MFDMYFNEENKLFNIYHRTYQWLGVFIAFLLCDTYVVMGSFTNEMQLTTKEYYFWQDPSEYPSEIYKEALLEDESTGMPLDTQ